MQSTVIVGLGNPVLADDSVGLHVAAELRRRLAGRNGFTTLELYSGGLLLMEAMAGHDRAIVIDAMVGGGPAGAIHRLGPEDLPRTRTTNSTHDSSLPVALELGRAAGLRLPADIRIWAIEAADVETFSQRLTPQVALASRRVVGEVMRELAEPPRTSP